MDPGIQKNLSGVKRHNSIIITYNFNVQYYLHNGCKYRTDSASCVIINPSVHGFNPICDFYKSRSSTKGKTIIPFPATAFTKTRNKSITLFRNISKNSSRNLKTNLISYLKETGQNKRLFVSYENDSRVVCEQ